MKIQHILRAYNILATKPPTPSQILGVVEFITSIMRRILVTLEAGFVNDDQLAESHLVLAGGDDYNECNLVFYGVKPAIFDNCPPGSVKVRKAQKSLFRKLRASLG